MSWTIVDVRLFIRINKNLIIITIIVLLLKPIFMKRCIPFILDMKSHFQTIIVTSLVLFALVTCSSIPLSGQNCTVNAGVDDSICPNQPMQLHGTSAGLYTGLGNIHWTQKSGPSVIIVDPYDMNTYVTGYTQGGHYSFYL